MQQIPVYVFTGFLDAGKTKFIQETLEDPRFNAGERTLLLVFEEGEEKGDKILHGGDEVEINGDIVTDEQGNRYYPIRMKKGDIYVQRYVTAKYIDIPIE